ncbi:hypothetical protein [Endozoicomonas sp. GU-1]|uniref:hypothetical protein n=1 Tax=Endozoicomonas sp. GU-1 TaxID=3009078 RepID=UPI0022B3AFF9|nr:hypothetical protein [Endozoicomonas sp. GU-1]WBA80957.1 hypothetical protein O2T12_22060 [Endozoicomonas sp. GU-1]WBA88525.1 hypothetical protein O3276_11260 [Endozoicomonas sp. GU-1]
MRIFLCLFLALIPLQGMALFLFEQNAYSANLGTWNGGDLEGQIAFRLQSCFAGPFCLTFVPYSLSASGFGFRWNGNDVDDENVKLESVVFTQGGNSANLVDGGNKGPFNPGTGRLVDAQLRVTVMAAALESALPGTYRAAMNLRGWEMTIIPNEATTRFDLELVIPPLFKISGLEDIPLTSDGDNDADSGYRQFCVFSQGGGSFTLRAKGDGDDKFELNGPNAETIDYEIHMRATASPENGQIIAPNTSYSRWNGSPNLNDHLNQCTG